MAASPIRYQDRSLRLFKCAVDPDLDTRTILVEDQWDYVEMWLKRNQLADALFFWKQAEAFAKASRDLPNTSSPLTKYYAAMNAAKALLHAKGKAVPEHHGVKGCPVPGAASLAGEMVTLLSKGVAPELCRYLGEAVNKETYTLEDILYNLPYIHRAFTITVPTRPELFIPIADPVFVRIDGHTDSYFRCKIVDKPYQNDATVARLVGYEQDAGMTEAFVVRRKARFRWDDTLPLPDNVAEFKKYYRGIRQSTVYIKGTMRLWYIKATDAPPSWIGRSPLTLTYMALHRISELARYTPDVLARHFDSQHNWLLSEFINLSLQQFLDEISAEMTGHEFMPPGVVLR